MLTTGFRPTITRKIPTAAIAHRTSPTNQGLLSSQPWPHTTWATSAWTSSCDRLERTFDSLEKLEKHWGHFYNWYDTRTLQPLSPLYISTVDSGNFLACLVALKQGLREKLRSRAGPLRDDRPGRYTRTDRRNAPIPGTRPIERLLQEQPDGLHCLGRLAGTVGTRGGDACSRRSMRRSTRRGGRVDTSGPRRLLSQVRRSSRRDLAALDSRRSRSIRRAGCDDRLLELIRRAEALGAAMDFRPLYKSERHLLRHRSKPQPRGSLTGPVMTCWPRNRA